MKSFFSNPSARTLSAALLRFFSTLSVAALLTTSFAVCTSQAIFLTSRSEKMTAYSTCENAGTFKLRFEETDYRIISTHLADHDYVRVRVTLSGVLLEPPYVQPVICKPITGDEDLPWQDDTVVLDVLDLEVSDVSTEDGVPDVTAYVYGERGNPYLDIYITGMQAASDWNDEAEHPWIILGLYDRVIDEGDGFSTNLCLDVRYFGPSSLLTINMDFDPATLTYNTSDNQIGYFEAGPDGDGVNYTEELGPDGNDPDYDGNGDGTADWQQRNVSSYHPRTKDEDPYITLAVPQPLRLVRVSSLYKYDAPKTNVDFPVGIPDFTILTTQEGEALVLTIYLECDPPDTFYNYGQTSNADENHWYRFDYDGETGAIWEDGVLKVHLVDGGRGDGDLKANGEIQFTGGPAAVSIFQALVFPYIAQRDDEQTALGVLNAEADESAGFLTYYDENGSILAEKEISLPGLGKLDIPSDDIPAGAASADITADGNLAGYARSMSSSGQRAAWPAVPLPESTASVPHVAFGPNWKTRLVAVNAADDTKVLTLTYDDGSQVSYSLAAHAQMSVELDASENIVEIFGRKGVAAIEMFESLIEGGDRAAVALKDRYYKALTIPNPIRDDNRAVGVGLMCLSDAGIVTVNGHDANGNVESRAFDELLLWERQAFVLSAAFGGDVLWAYISGSITRHNPYETPKMNLEAVAVRMQDGPGRIGAVKLNNLRFNDGFFAVVTDDAVYELVNPESEDAAVAVTGLNPDGEAVASAVLTIEAGKSLAKTASELLAGTSLDGVSHIRLVSDVQLCGLQAIHTDDRLEMLPVLFRN